MKIEQNYAIFQASFKLLLRNKGKILLLTEPKTGFLDLPGGRLDKKEATMPIKDLFKREISEELGKDVKYKILGPVLQYRRIGTYSKMHILMTAYEAEYLSGEIKLSSEHIKYDWADPKTYILKNKKMNNKEERAALEKYFKKLKYEK